MTSTTTTTIMDLRVKTWPSIQGWNRESKSSGTELKNGEAKQAETKEKHMEAKKVSTEPTKHMEAKGAKEAKENKETENKEAPSTLRSLLQAKTGAKTTAPLDAKVGEKEVKVAEKDVEQQRLHPVGTCRAIRSGI